MLLAIDAGNTNIVFAVYDGEAQVDTCRMETTGKIPESINEIVKQYPNITDVIISSVVHTKRQQNYQMLPLKNQRM